MNNRNFKCNSKIITFSLPMAALAAVAVLLGLTLAGSAPSWARPPFTDAQLADQQQQLLAEVNKGRDLWHGSKPSMSTTGLACGNCHPDAAASNPETFPKYVTELDRVAPLRDMINWCIEHPQGGTQLDVNSDDMVAMEAYAFYLNRGEAIQPGLAVPTGPYPVKSGVGFPWKPSGLGVDK
jgi:thiosulfate dehydrogenase